MSATLFHRNVNLLITKHKYRNKSAFLIAKEFLENEIESNGKEKSMKEQNDSKKCKDYAENIFFLNKHYENSICVFDYLKSSTNFAEFFTTVWLHCEQFSQENILKNFLDKKNLDSVKKVMMKTGLLVENEILNKLVTQSLEEDNPDFFDFFTKQHNFDIIEYHKSEWNDLCKKCLRIKMDDDFKNEWKNILKPFENSESNKINDESQTNVHYCVELNCVTTNTGKRGATYSSVSTLPPEDSDVHSSQNLTVVNPDNGNKWFAQRTPVDNDFWLSQDLTVAHLDNKDQWFDLLLWAIFACRFRMVRLLWLRIPDNIFNALLISHWMKIFSIEEKNKNNLFLSSELTKQSNEYEDIANELLNEAQSTEDLTKTESLLIKKIKASHSCFSLAYNFEISKIVLNNACKWFMTKKMEEINIKTLLLIYMIPNILFLLLFIYFMLFEITPIDSIQSINWSEYSVWFWLVCFIAVEVIQIIKSGRKRYIKSHWNRMDVALCILIICSSIARCIRFSAATICLSLLLALLIIRCLQYIYFMESLGPKLYMILKMFQDMALFLLIFFIFIVAFGTLRQSLTIPQGNETKWHTKLLNVVHYPFWPIFGELILDDLQEMTNCDELDGDCIARKIVVWIVFAVFILSVNILLVNLLISMFSSTYKKFQGECENVFLIYRYKLMVEHEEMFLYPPPVVVVVTIFEFIKGKIHSSSEKEKTSLFVDKKVKKDYDLEKSCVLKYREKYNKYLESE